jgi:hypothetical protein
MQPGGSLDPAHVAAAIAPIIDRLRLSVVAALRPAIGEFAERTGVAAPVLAPLSTLRNTLPDRVVAIDDVLEVFPHQPPEQIRSTLDTLVSAHMLDAVEPDGIRLGSGGRSLVAEVFERTQTFVDELWKNHKDLVDTLLPLSARACSAVTTSGGAAIRVMAPPHEPKNASPALKLVETLTPLRFHRFDSQAAAWRAEGLAVGQSEQLEPGEQRERIEADTHRRAAAPYAVLDEAERFTLLSGLGALPN